MMACKMFTQKFAITVALVILAPSLSNASNIKIGYPQVKAMRVSYGDMEYAIKAEVNNVGTREHVCFQIQAVDFEGFELKSETICGKVPINGVRQMTDTGRMPLEDWKRINKWQVKD